MIRLYDIERIMRTAKRLNKNFGDGTFTRKEFERVHNQYDIFCLQTMLDYGFLKVGRTEYYDIKNASTKTNFYATKGDLRIRVDKNDLEVFAKYGFLRENKIEKVQGKRYYYYVDYDKMREELETSKTNYLNEQFHRLNDKKSKIEHKEWRLNKIREELTLGV